MRTIDGPATPALPIGHGRFGLFPVRSPLLRDSRLLYFPGVTEMFHFTRFASARYLRPRKGPAFTARMLRLATERVVPLGDLGISACLAASPSLSQPSTSVIACWCQDIHHALLVA